MNKKNMFLSFVVAGFGCLMLFQNCSGSNYQPQVTGGSLVNSSEQEPNYGEPTVGCVPYLEDITLRTALSVSSVTSNLIESTLGGNLSSTCTVYSDGAETGPKSPICNLSVSNKSAVDGESLGFAVDVSGPSITEDNFSGRKYISYAFTAPADVEQIGVTHRYIGVFAADETLPRGAHCFFKVLITDYSSVSAGAFSDAELLTDLFLDSMAILGEEIPESSP